MLERMWREGNAHPLLVGIKICAATVEISLAVSQETGSQPPSGPSNSTLGNYPRDALSYYKSICSAMFIAALFVIARTWKQPRCPSIEEWLKMLWNIYTLEFYSVVNNSDILNFACKWMEIETFY